MSGKHDEVQDKDRFSILVPDMSKCWVCGNGPTHIHEVFYGPYRPISKREGLCLGLCGIHHNVSICGIHYNKALDLKAKQFAEKIWIDKNYKDNYDEGIMAFIRMFGRNYLDD